MRGKAGSPLLRSAGLLVVAVLFFFSSLWVYEPGVAARRGPPRSLPHSCLAPGRPPAPGRWRGAIRRASFDSPSQLPLFNQIIGKVNLLDSRSLQPPPFPRSPRPRRARLRVPASPRGRPATPHKGEGPGVFFFCARGEGQLPASVWFFPSPPALYFISIPFLPFLSQAAQPPSAAPVPTSSSWLPVVLPKSWWLLRGRGCPPALGTPPALREAALRSSNVGCRGENKVRDFSAIAGAFQSCRVLTKRP